MIKNFKRKCVFWMFETVVFIFPAFPQNFNTRIQILGAYLVIYFMGVEKLYVVIKHKITNE